jgi:hypothetical protein
MLIFFSKYRLSVGALAKLQLFCKLWFLSIGSWGLKICCNVGEFSSFLRWEEKTK